MDHQAIVWCHDVLEVVRELIWILSSSVSDRQTTSTTTVNDRLHSVKERLVQFRKKNSNRKIGSSLFNSDVSSKDYSDEVDKLTMAFRVSCWNLFDLCVNTVLGFW